jgi:hypothetical protein
VKSHNQKAIQALDREDNSLLRKHDLSGQTFGNWLVSSFHQGDFWFCRCACGTESWVKSDILTSKDSTGCIRCKRSYKQTDLPANASRYRYSRKNKSAKNSVRLK